MATAQPIAVQRRFSGGAGDTAWAIIFDAVIEEEHTGHTTVTKNPVETGVQLADHAFDDPDRLTIVFAVSDVVPPNEIATSQSQATARSISSFSSSSYSRSQEAFKELTNLRRAHEPFDVQTGLKLYQNMFCTDIKVTQDKRTASILRATVQLEQILYATTQAVIFPVAEATRAKHQTAPLTNDGKQESKEPDAAELKKANASWLKQIVSFTSGSS
jgi:hypothetical protein